MSATLANLSEADVLREVRRRYRIFSYLLVAAAIWLIVGGLGSLFAISAEKKAAGLMFDSMMQIGLGIMTAAYAVLFAVYRCPACDRGLSLRKKICPGCGIKVR